MSRKRSEAAIQAYHERFVQGAQRKHGVDAETAERVFAMVKGFSGFGFPKAHGAAFGLLAYQSTWLRVHYTPELLCSLLNEQPMGFYPPDALVHEAQRRGIEVLAARRQRERGRVRGGARRRRGGARRRAAGAGSDRPGLRPRACATEEVTELVAAREAGGRFRSLSDLASRAGSSASSLELLAWSGACDSPGANAAARSAPPRVALWQLGVMTPGTRVPGGTQLALPLDLPAPPSCARSRSGRRCSPTTAPPG